MFIVDMNGSSDESIGIIYLSNCSWPTQATSNVVYSELKIGFTIGIILSVIIVVVVVLFQTRYARRLYRAQTIRFGLNQLV